MSALTGVFAESWIQFWPLFRMKFGVANYCWHYHSIESCTVFQIPSFPASSLQEKLRFWGIYIATRHIQDA